VVATFSDITTLRLLDEDRRYLAALVGHMDEAVVSTDLELRVLSWSPGAERAFGYSAAEAIGRRMTELVPRPAVERDFEGVVRQLTAAGTLRLASEWVGSGGRRIFTESTLVLLRGAGGEPTGTLGVIRDVTAEHAARERLAESEERLRSMFAAMAEGVVLHGPDGRVLDANAAAARILGLTRTALLDQAAEPRWCTLCEDGSPFPDERLPVWVTLRTGERCTGVVLGVQPPGAQVRWLVVNSEPLRLGPGGDRGGAVVTFSDITELRGAQERIRESEARLARVLEASRDGFFDLNLASGVSTRSDRVTEILGIKPGAMASSLLGFLSFLHPEDRPGYAEEVDATLGGTQAAIDRDVRARSADGGWRWLHVRAGVSDAGPPGSPRHLSGILTDVTAQRVAEHQLREALRANEDLVVQLRDALEHVKTLRGFLPICMYCHRIRNDKGYWDRIEKYITERSEAQFSHGMCPQCAKDHFPDVTPSGEHEPI
jgi:PAS domain S-box-containing protein